MRILTVLALALVALVPCKTQGASPLDSKSTKGTFYVTVDDAATIYINGNKFYDAPLNESRTPETELKTDDHIVVALRDDGGGRRFQMVFVSADNQTLVNFRSHDFKIVPDLGVTDFTSEQFQNWTRFAVRETHKAILPVKNYSDYLWGDLNKCTIACVVKIGMFSHRPQ